MDPPPPIKNKNNFVVSMDPSLGLYAYLGATEILTTLPYYSLLPAPFLTSSRGGLMSYGVHNIDISHWVYYR